MSQNNIHSDWLNQIDVTGPFLAIPVLSRKFATGLPPVDPQIRQKIRFAYDEWVNDCETNDPDLTLIHQSWVDLVLTALLDYEIDILKSGNDINESLKLVVPEYEFTLRPDYVLINDQDDNKPFLLVQQYPPGAPLDKLIEGEIWKVSPVERMVRLCRVTHTRLGLITNGEQWMLVDAPEGGITSFASWYARYWIPEPLTLQAFQVLLGVSRFFGPKEDSLITMIDESLGHQDEVTEALGKQVTRAIEVFVQKLDQIDQDRNRELLRDTKPGMLYEAGLTVMMRLVFLLCAEERGLLLLDDEKFDAFYAVSSIRQHLAQEPDFILEKRSDAWSRLLAIFRAVYGGIDHETMRMPALGGSLFDPDRFPFLEGRASDSNWKVDLADPLEIDNRTVLLLLESIQLYEGRTLSYQALDVEQIGYVYEGLLERTVEKTKEITIELDATQSSKQPWVTLPELDSAKLEGPESLQKLLTERLASSRVSNDLKKAIDENEKTALLYACDNDAVLCQRLLPYAYFIKKDGRGEPLVYPKGSFRVALGNDRRDTGTHYTPKSLTEAIVKETLEPLAYAGPAEGAEPKDWQLKSSGQLLDLKVCDMAMGSGAFLVQVVRYLSERLLEAWDAAVENGQRIAINGLALDQLGDKEPMSNDIAERETFAKRLIAERCIYGVDLNPLAVELAKLSIWLVTMAKDRPFGFLDHNLKSGDSLLGIQNLNQLYYLEMNPGTGSSEKLFAGNIRRKVNEAIQLRKELRRRPILDIHDVEAMERMEGQSQQVLKLPYIIADGLIGEVLISGSKKLDVDVLAVSAGEALAGSTDAVVAIQDKTKISMNADLHAGKPVREPFHWPLEFPEVFLDKNEGFDAIIGNPPFIGGSKISTRLGPNFLAFLLVRFEDSHGKADLCAYFVRQASKLTHDQGYFGFILTNTITQGATKDTCLSWLLRNSHQIYWAIPTMKWPGKASVEISLLATSKAKTNFAHNFNDTLRLGEAFDVRNLAENKNEAYIGTVVIGKGFEVTAEERDILINEQKQATTVIQPYINGSELNKYPDMKPRRWIINFFDWALDRETADASYTGPIAADYPGPLEIVKLRVKPQRDAMKRKAYRERWWRYAERQSALYDAISSSEKVLVVAQVGKHLAFTFLPNNMVYDQKLIVFTNSTWSYFALYQSTIHHVWARRPGSLSLRSDPTYTVGYCCETFPRPDECPSSLLMELERVGEEYYTLRSEIMQNESLGLTAIYNWFHNSEKTETQIIRLRELHSKLDSAVISAYGWKDIELSHGFYDVEGLIASDKNRYTISENARSLILSRLSRLNMERYERELSSYQEISKRSESGKTSLIGPGYRALYDSESQIDEELLGVAEPSPQSDLFDSND